MKILESEFQQAADEFYQNIMTAKRDIIHLRSKIHHEVVSPTNLMKAFLVGFALVNLRAKGLYQRLFTVSLLTNRLISSIQKQDRRLKRA